MKKLRVAVIGQGRSGRDIHCNYLRTAPELFEIAYICDTLEIRRNMALEAYPDCEVLSDYREIFIKSDIDFVVNASFSHMHYPITKDLLEHGFNVLCEKPFVRTVKELDELERIASEKGLMLAVFQQSRFAPYFKQVKEVIASGVLGKLFQIGICFNGFARRWDWQTVQRFNGGSLYNTGPHPLDQALNLLGDYDHMPNVFCRMGRANTWGDAEDYVKLILTSPNKPLIDLEIISCDAYPSVTYNIKGSRGGLSGSMTDIRWKYYLPEDAPTQKLLLDPLMNAEGHPLYCAENLPLHEQTWSNADSGAFTNAVEEYYRGVYDYLTQGIAPQVALKQVRQQIAVIEEAHRQNVDTLDAFV